MEVSPLARDKRRPWLKADTFQLQCQPVSIHVSFALLQLLCTVNHGILARLLRMGQLSFLALNEIMLTVCPGIFSVVFSG